MKCTENCGGTVPADNSKGIWAPTSEKTGGLFFPCSLCGRLHWVSGRYANTREEYKTFFRGKKVVAETPQGSREIYGARCPESLSPAV